MKIADIKIGDFAKSKRVVTQKDVDAFISLSGDTNKLHIDPVYSGNTVMEAPVVHGMFGMSLISAVIGTQLPGDGALWFHQDSSFIKPVRVGDCLAITVRVLDKKESMQYLKLKTEIINQNNDICISGTALVRLIPQDHE
jgi:acyl dehydratase